ncbi:MAG: tetratricopeptide repeat protein [Myxococcales bacterium]|nr:tetratricopeptide repeat protein [Myxococcales bacterium]
MKAWMPYRPWMISLLIAVCLLVGDVAPAVMAQQDESKTPPPASQPNAAIPDTVPGVQAAIEQLEKQIADLESEADKLVSVNDQEKRQAIRKQIKTLRFQIKILQNRMDQLQQTESQAGAIAVREKYREKIRAYEAQKAAVRREIIAQFEANLARNPNSRVAPDILWRLANLYFEEAHANYLEAWDRYEKEADQLYHQGATDVVPEEPKRNYERSVEILGRILKDYPAYDQKDQVYYLMAYCLQESNEDDRALQIYDRLIKDTPESAYVPEAYVRMGEIYFERDQFDKAIERYLQLMKYPTSKFYDKALYKLGWSYYKMNDYENSVKYFTQVLEYYKNRSVTSHKRGKVDDLLQESIDYIAISFTESEGQQGGAAALAFMKKLNDQDLGRQILMKVGEVYDERTDYEPARQAYDAYLKAFPLGPEVPDIYSKIAQMYEKESRFEDAVEVYTMIGKALGPDSEWARVNGQRAADLERAAKLRQTSIMAAATFHHEKAQNTSGAEQQAHYQKAIENYQLYLANYPDSDNAYESAFNLAECFMELQQYPQAADQYQKVIDIKKDKELWTNALFNKAKAFELEMEKEGGLPNKEAIEARDKKISEGKGSEQPKGVAIKPQPLSATAGKWIAALEQHVNNLPESDKSPAMLYKIGEIYYLYGDFDNARKYFEDVFAKYPNNEVVAFATYYYIESYKQRDDYQGIIAATQRLPKSGNTGISAEQVQSLTAGATFKIAEQKLRDATSTTPVDTKLVQEAINEYEKGIKENPGDKLADVAMLNIAVAYENHLKDLVRANDAYLRLARDFPKSTHAPEALMRAAYNYQVLIEFDQAAGAYEKFYQQFPDNKDAGNALFNAAALQEDSKRYSSASPLFETYLSKFATETDAAEVAFTIAQIHEKMGDKSGAVAAYENYAKRGNDDAARMSEAYFRWGSIEDESGRWSEAEKRYLQAVAVFVKAHEIDANVEARYASEAQFRIAMHAYDSYKAMVFTGNLNKDTNILKEKAEAFKKLKEYFEQTVTFGNYTWATASLHMIGVINQDFAEALLNAPTPKDLPQEQQDEYLFKLEEIAFPVKNRALEAYKQNVQKGINERLINEWIVKSFLELKKLEPETKEPKFEKVTGRETPSFAFADIDLTLPVIQTPAPTTPPGGTPPAAPAAPPAGGKKEVEE